MDRPIIYVGSEANVWHAVLTWAKGEAFDTIDGSEGSALVAALGATLFSETRSIHVTNAQVVPVEWWERESVRYVPVGALSPKTECPPNKASLLRRVQPSCSVIAGG